MEWYDTVKGEKEKKRRIDRTSPYLILMKRLLGKTTVPSSPGGSIEALTFHSTLQE